MKVLKSHQISAFGGLEFVLEFLTKRNIHQTINEVLPSLSKQSKYGWNDLFYSLLSIYLCGGSCIEDLQEHLKAHLKHSPFFNITSPDTLLRRLGQLTEENKFCRTKRGLVDHCYNTNSKLETLNLKLLKKLGVFNTKGWTMDYDNTILFTEKMDSKMTYKRMYGYQPGVATVNEELVLFIENRNGNSDAKSFQADTLLRMFKQLQAQGIPKPLYFRADAASYQYDVIKLLEEHVTHLFIGTRNSYVEKYYPQVTQWQEYKVNNQVQYEVGEIYITPFLWKPQEKREHSKPYRLIVKRTKRVDGQVDMLTNDAYEYRSILTNNTSMTALEAAQFYNRRGNMERQFDIMKNDFGWNKLPFSRLEKNTVFLYFTAICRNLYKFIITEFSKRVKGLKPTDRLKKFIFRFIILPSRWVRHARNLHLRIYGDTGFKT
tara:strand:+ start:109 stop:1404 length:1296 start_codon:yes stop_codon:yes gene_type:complete